MRKVNLKDIPEQERKSPKGKFGRVSKNISIALGREPESLDLSKRHPFDLALVRIPKGKTLCPYHAHAAESELYLVVSGRGTVRDKDAITEVGPGDAFLFQPGEAHQLSNAGDEDFVYYSELYGVCVRRRAMGRRSQTAATVFNAQGKY